VEVSSKRTCGILYQAPVQHQTPFSNRLECRGV
jgi:hypothetical protein